MTESERYNEMSDEFEKLRLSLLPEKFDSTGPYPQEIIVRASAYHVLVHAEIESYIEDRVKDVGMKATRSWKEHKQSNKTILNLLAFSGQTMEAPPESLNPTQENQKKDWANKIDISKKISNATTGFFHSCGE